MFYFGQQVFSLYYDDNDSKDHYTVECHSSESNYADYYYNKTSFLVQIKFITAD